MPGTALQKTGIKVDDISQHNLWRKKINVRSKVFIKGLPVLRLIKARSAPPPSSIPVEIGVQTWFCFSWPAALLRSSPFGLAMRLLQSPAVTLQRREFTVFLLCFLKHEMHFSSALQEEKNNRDCDFIWSLLCFEITKEGACGLRQH